MTMLNLFLMKYISLPGIHDTDEILSMNQNITLRIGKNKIVFLNKDIAT